MYITKIVIKSGITYQLLIIDKRLFISYNFTLTFVNPLYRISETTSTVGC